MSVTIHLDNETTDRELAAIACLVAVLRSDQQIPAPPVISLDYSDQPAAAAPPPAAPAPPATGAPPAPPAPAAAPPPPASEALIAQEAQRAAGASVGELDSEGLPWDARIHSTPATKNATDGRWRSRRSLDEATKATVTAELKAKVAAGAPPAQPESPAPLPPADPAGAPLDAATAFGVGGAANASDAPPPPATDPVPPATPAPPAPAAPPPAADVPAAPPAPADPNAITYPQIVAMANDKGMTYDALNEISVSLGLQKFAELAKRPDLFPMFVSAVQSWAPPAA